MRWFIVAAVVWWWGEGARGEILPSPGPVSQAAASSPEAKSRKEFVPFRTPDRDDDTEPLAAADGKEPSYVARGEVLVRFRPGVAQARKDALLKRKAASVRAFNKPRAGKPPAPLKRAAGPSLAEDLVLVQLRPEADLAAAIAQFERQAEVLYAEPNYRLRLLDRAPASGQNPPEPPPRVPDDFEFPNQWALQNHGQTGGQSGADMRATVAWQYTTGSRQVKVAVIDTGIDYFHPDLAPNIWTNTAEIPGNGVDDDGNGFIDDLHGYDFVSDDGDPMDDQDHGTHVAGIIGAVGGNGIGIAGVCWEVTLLALKAFDEDGSASLDQVIAALDYAVRNGATIINASWGTDDRSRALQDAVREAWQAGVTIIAAGGNEQKPVAIFPAGYEEVIAVAATDFKDQRAFFSNHGPQMDLAAPGDFILSTVPNNAYDYRSGTSMAAPCVSGVAALVLSRHPEFTNAQVGDILRNSADPILTDQELGYGRLNALRAVRIDAPLPEARLDLPPVIQGAVALRGTASGAGFTGYSLAFGVGSRPTNWNEFFSATTPVQDGVLCDDVFTSWFADGVYVLQLTVSGADGHAATVRRSVRVANVQIESPQNNDVLRAGEKIAITGTVFGFGRTFTLQYGSGVQPTSWLDAGLEVTGGGSEPQLNATLATWDTRQLEPDQFYALKLVAREHGRLLSESVTRMIYLESRLKPGWPQYVPVAGELPKEDWRDFVVADLDGDGCQEIVLVEPANSDGRPARLLVYSCEGGLRWTKELTTGPPYADIPVVGDVEGDGRQEIFVDVGARLSGFRFDGSPLAGRWPIALEAGGLGKVLADLDGDGRKELIGLSESFTNRDGAESRLLLVFDAEGNLLRRWNLAGCDLEVVATRGFPAVGNLDDEPGLEIVAVSGCYELTAFKLALPGEPLWTACADGALVSSPVIGDLDADGAAEVVISAYSTRSGQEGGLYLFDRHGKLREGWPVLGAESFAATAALADLDGDGTLEICIGGWRGRYLHVVEPSGFEAPGWPVDPTLRAFPRSNAIIGDVDGDGSPDVLFGSPGRIGYAVTGDLANFGGLRAWNAAGQAIDFNRHEKISALLMENSGGVFMRNSAPVLTDLDGDGELDIVAISNLDVAYGLPDDTSASKNRSTIYVWRTGTPYRPAALPWPAFQGNAQHTGNYERPKPPNRPPVVADIPDQIVRAGSEFFAIELDQYVEDADHTKSQLTWTVSGNQALVVTIDPQRVATIRAPSPDWLGAETLRFTATDPAGASSTDEATFDVRLDYSPPVATGDRATTPEDTPIILDLLANDLSPQGYPLRIAGLSKPEFGTLAEAANGAWLYTPRTNYFGADHFTYTLSDGQGGFVLGTAVLDILPVSDPPVAETDLAITGEDTPVELNVLANDHDADLDPLRLLGFTQPAHGTVVSGAVGLIYSPQTNFAGLDSFQYDLTDDHGEQATGIVKVLVKPFNDSPVPEDLAFTLNRNASQTFSFRATDAENDTLRFNVVKGPEHGSVWAYPTVATYYPNKSYVGADSLTFTATDGNNTSVEATVRFAVLEANNLPDAAGQSLVVRTNRPLTITLTATDLDGDPLEFEVVQLPEHGALTGAGTNQVYQPAPDFLGNDRFTFRASDGQSAGAEATVSIKVTDQNTAPRAESRSVVLFVNQPASVTLAASDGESDALTYEILKPPAHGSLTGAGPTMLYTPAPGFSGYDRFEFRVSDGELESGPGTMTLAVKSPNQPPVALNLSTTVLVNSSTLITLPVTDADGNPLRAAILKGPRRGRLAGVGTEFRYTPQPNFLGLDSFTFLVWDGQAYSKRGKVSLSINATPPPLRLAVEPPGLLANGQVRLRVVPAGPSNFHVQTSTNLLDWVTFATHSTSGEPAVITDTNAPGFALRFYRAVQF